MKKNKKTPPQSQYQLSKKEIIKEEFNKLVFKIKYFIIKLTAGTLAFILVACYFVGCTSNSNNKIEKGNSPSTKSKNYSSDINSSNEKSNNEQDNQNILKGIVYSTQEGIEIVGNLITDTVEKIEEKKDIKNDLERAKERTEIKLQDLEVIKFIDYETTTTFVDVEKLKRTRFVIKDEKTLIETWIIGEVLSDISPEYAIEYYKNIVYRLPKSDNSIYCEQKFTSKIDFALFLGLNTAEYKDIEQKIDELFTIMIHEINGYVFAKEQISTNIESESNQVHNYTEETKIRTLGKRNRYY